MDTPTEVVDASYKRISFEAGLTPEWERFRQLFVDNAILALRVFPSDPQVYLLSLSDYAEFQMREGLQHKGYTETPGPRAAETIGDVAVVRQEFVMQFGGQEPVRAIDVFSLARGADGWRIVSIVSDFLPARDVGQQLQSQPTSDHDPAS